MEVWQREWIRTHIMDLRQDTKCGDSMLQTFYSCGLFERNDVISLRSFSVESEARAFQLYDLIQTKTTANGPSTYEKLIETLYNFRQIGPANILTKGYDQRPDVDIPLGVYILRNKISLGFRQGLRGLSENEKITLTIVLTSDVSITAQRIQTSIPTTNWDIIDYTSGERIIDGDVGRKSILIVRSYDVIGNFLREAVKAVGEIKIILISVQTKDHIKTELNNMQKLNPSFKLNTSIIEDNVEWANLDERSQNSLLKESVDYQGKVVKLEEIANGENNALQAIQGQLLTDIINCRVPKVCSLELSEIPSYYVPRKLEVRHTISNSIFKRFFKTKHKDVLVISNVPEGFFDFDKSKDLNINLASELLKKSRLRSSNIIILDIDTTKDRDFEDLCKKAEDNSSLHLITRIRKDNMQNSFQWIRSYGSIELIQELIKPSAVELEDIIINDTIPSPIFIYAPRTAGKTTLLASLSKKIKENHPTRFVGYVRALHLLEHVKSQKKCELSLDLLFNFILNKMKATEFAKTLVKSLLDKTKGPRIKFEVMLDGICLVLDDPKYSELTKQVILLLKQLPGCRLWVTSCSSSKRRAEIVMNTFGCSMLPLDRADRLKLLEGIQREKGYVNPDLDEKIKMMTNKYLDEIEEVLASSTNLQIYSIPMQFEILAELLLQDAKEALDEATPECVAKETSQIYKWIKNKIHGKQKSKFFKDVYARLVRNKFILYWKKNKENMSKEAFIQRMEQMHMWIALQNKFGHDREIFKPFLQIRNISSLEINQCGLAELGEGETFKFNPSAFADYFSALPISRFGFVDSNEGDKMAGFILNSVLKLVPGFESYQDHQAELPTFELPLLVSFIQNLLPSNYQKSSKALRAFIANHWISGGHKVKEYQVQILALIAYDYFKILNLALDAISENKDTVKILMDDTTTPDFIYFAAKYSDNLTLKQICDLKFNQEKTLVNKLAFRPDQNPLFAAVQRGNSMITKDLIRAYEFDPFQKDQLHRGILHYCVYQTKYESETMIKAKEVILKYILKHYCTEAESSALLEYKDFSGKTPLLQPNVNFELIKCLLERSGKLSNIPPSNIKEWDGDGRNVLHILFEEWTPSDKSFEEHIEYLIGKGADVNIVNYAGQTLLHIAARSGNLQGVKFLLNSREYKNSVNLTDKENRTPIQEARSSKSSEIVQYLIEKGATDA